MPGPVTEDAEREYAARALRHVGVIPHSHAAAAGPGAVDHVLHAVEGTLEEKLVVAFKVCRRYQLFDDVLRYQLLAVSTRTVDFCHVAAADFCPDVTPQAVLAVYVTASAGSDAFGALQRQKANLAVEKTVGKQLLLLRDIILHQVRQHM